MNNGITSNDGRSTRWEQHRRSRYAELIKAARAAVHDLGPNVSMEEIAAHAGTSKTVFYRYFGDKNGLQQAVSHTSIEFVEQGLRQAVFESTHPLEGLQTMIGVYLRLAESSPNVYAFSIRSSGELADFFHRITELMTPIFNRYMQHRHPQVKQDHTLRLWPTAAIGFVRHAGEVWLLDSENQDRPSADQLARKLTEWLVQGLQGPQTNTPMVHTLYS